jgi:hypothetical protein
LLLLERWIVHVLINRSALLESTKRTNAATHWVEAAETAHTTANQITPREVVTARPAVVVSGALRSEALLRGRG